MATRPNAKAKEILVDEEIATQEYTEVVETPKPVKKEPQKPTWEIKDRTYIIADSHAGLTYTLQSRHSVRYPLLWFNQETGEQEELRYATNQNSPLVSEQKGQSTLGHIMFENGVLNVPKERQNLQKLLSIYHPALNKKYTEFNAVVNCCPVKILTTAISISNALLSVVVNCIPVTSASGAGSTMPSDNVNCCPVKEALPFAVIFSSPRDRVNC